MKAVTLYGNYSRYAVLVCLGVLLVSCASESAGLVAYRQHDYSGAVREFRKEEGPSADFAIGVMHYKGQGVRRDVKKAAAYFYRAADAGHAGAQYNLGLMYANGLGLRRDFREAARWYRQAADNGNDRAQYNLGIMYARGDGVQMDQRKALYWLAKSARQGNPRALKCLKLRLDQNNSAGRTAGGGQRDT